MASFWWDVRTGFKKCYFQVFFISLCFACVKCIVSCNHNNSKKLNRDFVLKKYILPTAHVEEITDMSPVFILSYENVSFIHIINLQNSNVFFYLRLIEK